MLARVTISFVLSMAMSFSGFDAGEQRQSRIQLKPCSISDLDLSKVSDARVEIVLSNGGCDEESSNEDVTPAGEEVSKGSSSERSDGDEGQCRTIWVDESVLPDFVLARKTSENGAFYRVVCAAALVSVVNGKPKFAGYQASDVVWVSLGGPAPSLLSVPSVRVLAEEAVSRLVVPVPSVGWGPLVDPVLVNVPVWLWVDDPGRLSASVSLRGVSVSVSASVVGVSWVMGEPVGRPGVGGEDQSSVVVVCDGVGVVKDVVPNAFPGTWGEPECGYVFRWRSSPERTGGVGAWAVRTTVLWRAVWSSSTGESGHVDLESSVVNNIRVQELRGVLVAHPPGR